MAHKTHSFLLQAEFNTLSRVQSNTNKLKKKQYNYLWIN